MAGGKPERVVAPSPEIMRDMAMVRTDPTGLGNQLEGRKRFRRS